MKKILLVLIIPIIFIGCFKPSQEKLNSSWVDKVKGKTFIDTEDSALNFVFDDSANMIFGSEEGGLVALLTSMMGCDFISSPAKNKGVYKPSTAIALLLAFSSDSAPIYIGCSLDGDTLYFHQGGNTPEDIDWDNFVSEVSRKK